MGRARDALGSFRSTLVAVAHWYRTTPAISIPRKFGPDFRRVQLTPIAENKETPLA